MLKNIFKRNKQLEGHHAKLLIDNPIFETCIQELKSEFFEKWKNSNFPDTNNREELFKMVVALDLVVAKLHNKVFEAELEENSKENDEFDK